MPAPPEASAPDPRIEYDALRERCPVAWSEARQGSVLRHAEVLRVLHEHETFGNAVSAHPAVPNGYDPPQHTAYRRALDPFFAPPRMQRFEPVCRDIVAAMLQQALQLRELDVVREFALPFAVRVQSAFLGWPPLIQDELLDWLRRSREATRSGDRASTAAVAQEFERLVDRMRAARRESAPDQDISAELMHLQVDGRALDLRELASVLRNWTVGEVGTIAASIGILVHWLATSPDWQQRLRAQPALLPPAIDEVLRIDGPLAANRRIVRRAVALGGRQFEPGDRLTIHWIAANRDPRAFDEPDSFRIDRDPSPNLLYGAGIHVCPGAPLARLELRVLMEELLARTSAITLAGSRPPVRAVHPDAGYAALLVRLV